MSNSAAKPTPERFCFWLQGYLLCNQEFVTKGLTPAQLAEIASRLDNVFTHVGPAPAPAPVAVTLVTFPPKNMNCAKDKGECTYPICDRACMSKPEPRLEVLC